MAGANVGKKMCEEKPSDKKRRGGLVRRFRKKELEIEQGRRLEGRQVSSSDSPAGVAEKPSDPSWPGW